MPQCAEPAVGKSIVHGTMLCASAACSACLCSSELHPVIRLNKKVRLLMYVLMTKSQSASKVLSIALPWLAARAGRPFLPKAL